MKIINLLTGEQNTGISPHATTHHAGGTDEISAEAIGAEVEGAASAHLSAHLAATDPHPQYAFASSPFFSLNYGVGWKNHDSAYYSPGYRKVGGQVNLQGIINRGSTTENIIALLPIQFRPDSYLIFGCLSSAGIARVDVLSSGEVLYNSGISISWLSLDGISFFSSN